MPVPISALIAVVQLEVFAEEEVTTAASLSEGEFFSWH